MISLLRAAKRAHWAAATSWLFYSIVLGALPFWGIALVVWLSRKAVSALALADGAQLAVYAAGLLAASIPVMQKEVKDSPFRHPKWFLGATILVIAVAAIIFGADATSNGGIDRGRVLQVSIVLALAAIALGFFTELVSEIRSDPDLGAVRLHAENSLSRQVRQKVGDSNDD